MRQNCRFGFVVGSLVACVSCWSASSLGEDSPVLTKFERALTGIKAVENSDRTAAEKAQLKQRWYSFVAGDLGVELSKSIQGGNLPVAIEWADRAARLAVTALPAGHRQRSDQLLLRGKLKFFEFRSAAKPDSVGTLRVLEDALQDAETGRHLDLQVEALSRVALIQIKAGEDLPSSFARLLSVADAAGKDAPAVRTSALLFVWNNLWLRQYQLAAELRSAESPDAAEQALEKNLDRIRDSLIKAQAPDTLAHAGHLFLARFHVDTLHLDAAAQQLDRLEQLIEFAGMPAFWQIQWRIVKGRRASNLALFSESRSELEAALQIANTAKLPDLGAVIRLNLGELLLRQGDYGAAEDFLRDAKDAYESTPGLQADAQRPVALVSLAKTYESRGRFSQAVRLYEEAITLAEAAEEPNPLTLALCRNNLAACDYLAGKFDSARQLFGQVQTSLTGLLGEDHLRIAELKSNFAWLELESGDQAAANALFRESLKLAQETVGDAHPRTAEIMSYLARTELLSGRTEAATTQLRKALSLSEQHLNRTLRSALSERDRLAVIQELRVHPESSAWPGVFDTWLDLAPALSIPVEEQYHGVLAWKGALARHDFKTSTGAQEATSEVAQRERVLNELRSVYYAGAARLSRRERRDKIAALEAEANQLERRIAQSSGVSVREPITLERLRKSLPPRTAFLDVIQIRHYSPREPGEEVIERRSCPGFLVRSDAPIVRVEFGDVAELNTAAQDFFRALSGGSDYAESGQVLARKIREPLDPLLEDIDCLIICGDGLLHLLPLGALPDREPDSFWMDRMAFASIGSAHSFVESASHRATTSARTALVIGGLEYGKPAEGDGKWTPLPGTLRESRRIVELLSESIPKCEFLTGSTPTEPAIRAQLQSAQLIHLATHGFFGGKADRQTDGFEVLDIATEMDSAIVLAGANNPVGDDDALLTAAELGDMDLRHVRLMVLSACQTGLGHIRAGQGLVGLLGALSRSGVQSTVSSLWEVNDEATASLMAAFYSEMQRDAVTVDLAGALRRAQMKLRNGEIRPAGGGSFKHPRFWAAFFLSGLPRTTISQSSPAPGR